ncbi:uncharacterized protein L203_105453 [Cryptococcus depauperatus CBS 7841]|uniref:Uncharacterized protein n=1 Tax=Cryptococcus depauperatus CBS 7841 TaxID=1295531 RepID=A0AAJ8JXC7_9TREE
MMACLLLCRQGVDVLPKKNSSLDARGCIRLLKWRSTFLLEPSMLKKQSLRHSLLTQVRAMGMESAAEKLEDAISHIVNVINSATKAETSGYVWSGDGFKIEL